MPEPASEQSLFLRALELPTPEGRAAYLDEACRDNPALRAELDALLAAHDRLGGGQPRTTGQGPAGPGPGAGGEEAGAVLSGRYKLVELLGAGGMGAVWMAQQTEPVRRLVAVKVVKAGMDSKQVLARFEAERQALALMDHPNIAKVLDAGTTAAGRPYFVMELVKGVPITRYCDERRLTPRQRLGLFVAVCQAVQHAHQKGVIHRDLTPSNVLLALYDGKPVPKVIDFGIAKAAGQPLTERTLVTGFGAVVGTLEYMSPEQAELNQLDIDTRSDIYSLGVLLYELLTGTTPLEKKRLKQAALLEVLRLIREEEPPKPSTRLSGTEELPSLAANRGLEPRKLSGLVRGELDWIVMKALEKDRGRRYDTANGFAMDVQRYLADEPVQACPPSAGYRLRKFARRNKGRLAAAALVLLFLASLGGAAAWVAWDRADRRQEAALQQAAQRAALEADIGRDLDEMRAFCREDRLREASAVVGHAQALVARGGAGEGLGKRVAQARADVDMAAAVEAIRLERDSVKDGNFDFAGAEPRYRDAFRNYGLDVEALDAGAAAGRIQASAIKDQLTAALNDWLVARGGPDRHLLDVLCRADADPWRDRFRNAFARRDRHALGELARGPEAAAQPPATVVLLGQVLEKLGERALAVDVLRSAQQRHPDDFWVNHELARNLGESRPKRAAEAVRYYQAALALRPGNPGVHLNLGNALGVQGDLAGAEAAYRQALALKPDYAQAYHGLGHALFAQGNLAGAAAEYRKAIALKPDYAVAHCNLGLALRDQGDAAGAAAEFRKSLDLKPDYGKAHANLGVALRDQGDLAGAVAETRKAIALNADLHEAHTNLGNYLLEQGDVAGALAECRKGVELDPKNAIAHDSLSMALRDQGDLAGAVATSRKAIALAPEYAKAHANLGLALEAKGQLDEAIAAYTEALRLKKDMPETRTNLGLALRGKGQLDKAIAEFRKALGINKDFPEAYKAHFNLGSALLAKGRPGEAIPAFREAIRLMKDRAEAHSGLGAALLTKGRPDGAIPAFREAIGIDEQYAEAHYNLGNALLAGGRPGEAVDAYREAIRLKRDDAEGRYGLGNALREKGLLDEAAAEFRVAIRRKKDHAEAHCNLGHVLRRQGQFRQALEALRRGDELGRAQGPSWRYRSDQWVRLCERQLELDGQLPGFLAGTATPAGPAEQIELAELCTLKKQYAAATRFYADAFAAQAKLAEDRVAGHRYKAAGTAARAGAGRGEDARGLDAKEGARLRELALGWLRAEVAACGRVLDHGPAEARPLALRCLQYGLVGPDFAGVRDPEALARLPERERQAWQQLWAEVRDRLARAQGPATPKKKPATR